MKNKFIKWIYFPLITMDDIVITIFGGREAKNLINLLSKKEGVTVSDIEGRILQGGEKHWGEIKFPQSLAGEMKPLLAVAGDEHGYVPDRMYFVMQGDFPGFFQLDHESYTR